jgi:hypothetical protein
MYLVSTLGLFNKSHSLSSQTTSEIKDLFSLMREMLTAKGKEALFSTHIHFDEDLGMMTEKEPKKMDKSEKEVADELGDVRLKTLIALIAMAEKKGSFFYVVVYICCCCCVYVYVFVSYK